MAWTAADVVVFETAIRERIEDGAVSKKSHRGVSLEKAALDELRALLADARREAAAAAQQGNMPFTHLVPGRRR